VTVSVGAGDPGRRDRVLAALRQLITAAGSDIAVAGPVLAEHAQEAKAAPSGLSGVTEQPGWVTAERAGLGVGRSDRTGDGVLPGIRLEPGPRTLAVGGRRIELSRMEYDLLLFLARHPSQVFSRNQLLAQVWGHTHTGARTVDVHVSRLRTKLGADADVIATVYGLGYRLADHAAVTVVDR
jgi:DNA-binding response OmpR family regulator